MCLRKVIKYDILRRFKPERENKYNIGWKVFKSYDSELHPIYKGYNNIFPINQWINEKDFRPGYYYYKNNDYIDGPNTYRTGFHIYLDKKNAIKKLESGCGEVIKKVYFKNVVAKGYEYKSKIVVAKEMMIPKESI